MTRESWRAVRNRQNALMREVNATVEQEKAREQAIAKKRREEAAAAEAARVRFTADDIKGAKGVRDRFGWHPVVRVNAKTVTVATPYSWTDRIAVESVLEILR